MKNETTAPPANSPTMLIAFMPAPPVYGTAEEADALLQPEVAETETEADADRDADATPSVPFVPMG